MSRTPSYMINQQGRCKYDLPKSSSEFIRDSKSTISSISKNKVVIKDKKKDWYYASKNTFIHDRSREKKYN